MSDSGSDVDVGEEKLNEKVLPHLRCAKCQDFFRGQVFGCTNNHTTCSLCCGVEIGEDEDDDEDEIADEDEDEDESADEDKDAVVCSMEDCESKTSVNCVGSNLTRIVGDLRLKVPCKNRDAGCMYKGVEDEMEEHEDECEDRKVECDFAVCRDIPFKDLLQHLKDEHNIDFDIKKWNMYDKVKPTGKDKTVCYKSTYMFETGPDGLVFITDIMEQEGFFHIAVRVMGGKQVAKKYRVEMRVSSNKSSASITHNGPVFPIEYSVFDAIDDKDSFEISCPKFASFNHGKEYFGKHNEDKNGKIVLPVSVKIEKKKLGLSKSKDNRRTMPGGGLTAPKKLSPELAAIIGKKEASRAEVMKLLWAYIKEKNLQDPENKQFFTPDEKMAKVFGADKIKRFGMTKFLSPHLSDLDV